LSLVCSALARSPLVPSPLRHHSAPFEAVAKSTSNIDAFLEHATFPDPEPPALNVTQRGRIPVRGRFHRLEEEGLTFAKSEMPAQHHPTQTLQYGSQANHMGATALSADPEPRARGRNSFRIHGVPATFFPFLLQSVLQQHIPNFSLGTPSNQPPSNQLMPGSMCRASGPFHSLLTLKPVPFSLQFRALIPGIACIKVPFVPRLDCAPSTWQGITPGPQ
jgi:hypothetical protein